MKTKWIHQVRHVILAEKKKKKKKNKKKEAHKQNDILEINQWDRVS